MTFIEVNLLLRGSRITDHDDSPDEDEKLNPSLKSLIVLLWIHLITGTYKDS